MPEFRVVKRADVPNAEQANKRATAPIARLHKTGQLYLSVLAAEALGNQDCRVMIEFDEDARIMKFTVVDKLPRGITEADLFPVRIRATPRNKRPLGVISIRALMRYIGFPVGIRSQEFPIVEIDRAHRSISVNVPMEPPSSNGSSG